MAYYLCWIDSDHAKLFKFLPGKVDKKELTRNKNEHPHNHKHVGEKHHHDSPEFFDRVAKEIVNPNELLIVGPGMAKKYFKAQLDNKYKNLSEKVVGVESMNHPTDNQIVAKARDFFKAHDLFTAI